MESCVAGAELQLGPRGICGGSVSAAVRPLSRYVQGHPENEDARAELALSQFNTKEYAGARKTLELLEGKSGEAPQLQYAYAESLIETGDTSGGVERLLMLEKANPNVADVHRALGEAYVTEKTSGAAEELETAIRLNPADAEAHVTLGRLGLAQGDAKSAVRNLEER